MSIDEALHEALSLQQQGKINKALNLCINLLESAADDFRLHFLLGMLHNQVNETDAAITHFSEAVRIHPGLDRGHYNLGVLYFAGEDFEQAKSSYEQAAELCPDDPDIFFNLALTVKNMGLFQQARQHYEKVLALTPEDHEAHYNLGVLFRETDETEAAIRSFEKAVAIHPSYIQAHNNMAYLFHKMGQSEKALACYRKVLELDPTHQSAGHMVAALSGETTNTSPLSYVKDLFDQFSDDFDEALLQKLQYGTPAMLRQMLDEEKGLERVFQNGLDMGCGTGLSGLAFSDRTKRFTGLDLSTGMLEKAAEKGVYSILQESDINSFLTETEEVFDLFLAADVFVYLGDLSDIFERVRKKSAQAGCFLFSTETCGENFTLQTSGRYAHAESYIRKLTAQTGFAMMCCKPAKLRRERDGWIMGNLFLLRATN